TTRIPISINFATDLGLLYFTKNCPTRCLSPIRLLQHPAIPPCILRLILLLYIQRQFFERVGIEITLPQ
ncbi:hypothetical protein QT972_30780, partial [Microcoleus sp. herbarium7]|uniref:hypothetical protein n=1 Tax=Microcoleus sp. herbarium7 TaxID=3055435 RepID=UPI002FD2B81D